MIFLYHPDAHPNENQEYFKAKIQEITETYSILEHSISILKNDSIKSQNEIKQLKAGLLEQYIDKVSNASVKKSKVIQSILKPITMEVANKELAILNKFLKNNVDIFMKEYGLQIVESGNAFLWMMMEPLYFLDFIPDWYEKVLTKDNLPKISKK